MTADGATLAVGACLSKGPVATLSRIAARDGTRAVRRGKCEGV
jgi:hypothetical protein